MKVDLDGEERVVVRTRPHASGLRGAGWGLVLLLAATGLVLGFLSRLPALGSPWTDVSTWATLVWWIILAVLGISCVLRPVLRWSRRRIVLTTRRLIVFEGRTAREVPLVGLASVQTRGGGADGGRGPGTLELTTARGLVRIPHVPSVRYAATLVRREQVSALRATAPLNGWQ